MKIVHITTVHNPFDNRIFHKECTSMAELGHNVVLVVPYNKDETVNGVQIRPLPHPKGRLARMIFTARQAYQKALHEDADIYHFHDPELIIYALLLKKRGKKVIYDIHEDYSSSIRQKDYLLRPLRVMLADLFSYLEKAGTNNLPKILAEKNYKIRFPDGVEILNYPKRELLAIPLNKPTGSSWKVIYTGNITRDRGAYEHANIVNYMDDMQVYLVGYCDQELADQLYTIAGKEGNRLYITGLNRFVPFREIIDYYAMGNWTAGLAIFPPTPHYFKKELTKLFEYMSAGIPIICSDFPVWKELIEKTGSGICVNPADKEAIKAGLEYLASNRDEAIKMGLSGRSCVEKYYLWENEALKLQKLYREMF